MADENDNISEISGDVRQFNENCLASSKDNFLEWARERLTEMRDRFSWTEDELVAVMGLINEARNKAINDFGENMIELHRLMGCGHAEE
jgi:hypothetical protein